MIDILEIEAGIWVLEEQGENVFAADCRKFGIIKQDRKVIYHLLLSVMETWREEGGVSRYIEEGFLKKLERQPKALENNLWEIRDEGSGVRLIFVLRAPDSIIVSAVSKFKGSLSQAINRGANRWISYLRQKKE